MMPTPDPRTNGRVAARRRAGLSIAVVLGSRGLMMYVPRASLHELAGRFFDGPKRFDNCPVTDFAASDFTEFLDQVAGREAPPGARDVDQPDRIAVLVRGRPGYTSNCHGHIRGRVCEACFSECASNGRAHSAFLL